MALEDGEPTSLDVLVVAAAVMTALGALGIDRSPAVVEAIDATASCIATHIGRCQ